MGINMSWQRILESARKNGYPVIVTDIAGREPMVVMPFDTFEEMNEVYLSAFESWQDSEEYEYTELDSDENYHPEEPPESASPVMPPDVFEGVADSDSGAQSEVSQTSHIEPNDEVSHLSMEDKFYLEPVEDDS